MGAVLIHVGRWTDGQTHIQADRRTDKMEVMGAFVTMPACLKIKNQSCGDIDEDLKLKRKINPKMNA